LRDKIVSKLRLRRRNTVKERKELEDETKETSVKAPVRRSQSMVTTTRRKLGLGDKDNGSDNLVQPRQDRIISDGQVLSDQNYLAAVSLMSVNQGTVCQKCLNPRDQVMISRPVIASVRRTVSYHQPSRGRREMKKQPVQRSGTSIGQNSSDSPRPPRPPTSSSSTSSNASTNTKTVKVPRIQKSSTKKNLLMKEKEKLMMKENLMMKEKENTWPESKHLSTTGTQTENHYDYAYSSMVAPAAAMIGLKQDRDDDGSGNIYEEIIPPDKRMFYSISQGRRHNLEMYKFADWDLEERLKQPGTDKDNYIKPQEIKSSLNKKSSLRKLRTKESRNVTFASDPQPQQHQQQQQQQHQHKDYVSEGAKKTITVQRSRSVNVSSHNSSKHN